MLDTEFLFEPPKIDSVYSYTSSTGSLLLQKIEKKQALNLQEQEAQYKIASCGFRASQWTALAKIYGKKQNHCLEPKVGICMKPERGQLRKVKAF